MSWDSISKSIRETVKEIATGYPSITHRYDVTTPSFTIPIIGKVGGTYSTYLLPDSVVGLMAQKAIGIALLVGIVTAFTGSIILTITFVTGTALYALAHQSKSTFNAMTKNAVSAIKDELSTEGFSSSIGQTTRSALISLKNCCGGSVPDSNGDDE